VGGDRTKPTPRPGELTAGVASLPPRALGWIIVQRSCADA